MPHGGTSMEGIFLWSLVATDVSSGWTEAVPLVAREQSLVVEGIEVLRHQFPMPILGIDSDNDSAFINETLLRTASSKRLSSLAHERTTRTIKPGLSRRTAQLFGGSSDTSDSPELLRVKPWPLYQAMRLYVNFFQPSFKLRSKRREGAKVKKCYFKPATPAARLLEHAAVLETTKEQLRNQSSRLIWNFCIEFGTINRPWQHFAVIGAPGSGPGQENLEQFLANLQNFGKKERFDPRIEPPAQNALVANEKIPSRTEWPTIHSLATGLPMPPPQPNRCSRSCG